MKITVPHEIIQAKDLGINVDYQVPKLKIDSEYIPVIDENYVFNSDVTEAIIAGFINKKNVLIQGLHGTGKSTHIEQIAARLNWPCFRVNLDGNITRSDFLGRDYLVLKEGKQVLEFKEGILPWVMKQPMALILDEYDAARPEFLFILQRLLEKDGKLVIVEENKIIHPHPEFRIFATSNTLGSGDYLGIYAGTNQLNQAQLDRWQICINLDYLEREIEEKIITAKVPELKNIVSNDILSKYFDLFSLIRSSFAVGELSFVLSPRTLINWAENTVIFSSPKKAFKLCFVNKLLPEEKRLIAEFYQRCLAEEL